MAEYQKLSVADEDKLDFGIDPEEPARNPYTPSTSTRNLLPWIWCCFCSVIALLAVVRSILLERNTSPSTCTPGLFRTDFMSAPKIGHVENYFYNYHDFNPANHQLEFNHSMEANGVMYAGPPNPRIDQAWEELLKGPYMEISEEEANSVRKAAPWDLEHIEGHVYMQVGVFHDLHCLNLIRMALDPHHYNVNNDFTSELDPRFRNVHIYHCIDQLRQSIQCNSDLTPVPLFSVKGFNDSFQSHSVTHTCRDFEAVKAWRDERNSRRDPFLVQEPGHAIESP